jgi:hypothetical protein
VTPVMTTVVATALVPDRGYKVLTQGLMISRALTFEEWRACGLALAEVANRTNWAIGDWLVYGAGRGDYGEYYVEARTITGRSFESLSQYARLSQAFPVERRAVGVPWSFYREALRLPEHERQYSLTLAQRNQWTRDGFAEFISTRDGATPSVAKAISIARVATPRAGGGWHRAKSHHKILQCPSCGFKFEPKRRHRVVQAGAGVV